MDTRSKGAVAKAPRVSGTKQGQGRRLAKEFDDGANAADVSTRPQSVPASQQSASITTLSSVSMPATQPLSGFETPNARKPAQAPVNQDDVVELAMADDERRELEGAVAIDNRRRSKTPELADQLDNRIEQGQREQVQTFARIMGTTNSYADYQRWMTKQLNRAAANQSPMQVDAPTHGYAQNKTDHNVNNDVTNDRERSHRSNDRVANDRERTQRSNDRVANDYEHTQRSHNQVATDNMNQRPSNDPATMDENIRQSLAGQYGVPHPNVAANSDVRSVFAANPDLQFPPGTYRPPPADAIQVAAPSMGEGGARKVIDIRELYLRKLRTYKERLQVEAMDMVELKTICENSARYIERITVYVEDRMDNQILTEAEGDAAQQLWEEATDLGDYIKREAGTRLQYLQAGGQPSSETQNRLAHARRLMAKIDPFNGDWEQWPNFRSKWVEYYHNCRDLSGMDLMVKLDEFIVPRSEASELIAAFDRSLPDAYSDAWKELCDAYDNPRRQVDGIIGKFVKMPKIEANRDSYLRSYNHINSLVKTLPRMDVDVTTWDPILVHLLEGKLEPIPKAVWQQKRHPREVAQLQPFVDFLLDGVDKSDSASASNDGAARTREHRPNQNRDHSRERRSNQNRNHSRERRSSNGNSNQNERRGHQGSSQSNQPRQQGNAAENNAPRVKSKIVKPKKCPLCPNAEHTIYACPEFNRLNREGRIAKANQKQLCLNCLRPKCAADRCTLSACPNGCNEKHNRLLCRKTFAPTVNAAQSTDSQQ